MKKLLFIITCLIIYSFVKSQSVNEFNNYLQHNNQVLFVKTNSYASINGTMFLYERRNTHKNWKLIDSFNVTVGRNGLGKDVHAIISFIDSAPLKHEGDGKSPSGIFALGPVFSYHRLQKLHMPFVRVDTNFYCVDDAASSNYNTLIIADTAKHDYNSFEHMKRDDSLYEYGVWVKYNSEPVTNGNGSCIFLHIQRSPTSPTAGCTAMTKEKILKLIYWLNERQHPVLLQIAQAE